MEIKEQAINSKDNTDILISNLEKAEIRAADEGWIDSVVLEEMLLDE